ncbi:hypothetical protein KC323_g88 [Hortaea werneckii]|nr:hypothetical protein KC323_g88 [Hortaea werneckii]
MRMYCKGGQTFGSSHCSPVTRLVAGIAPGATSTRSALRRSRRGSIALRLVDAAGVGGLPWLRCGWRLVVEIGQLRSGKIDDSGRRSVVRLIRRSDIILAEALRARLVVENSVVVECNMYSFSRVGRARSRIEVSLRFRVPVRRSRSVAVQHSFALGSLRGNHSVLAPIQSRLHRSSLREKSEVQYCSELASSGLSSVNQDSSRTVIAQSSAYRSTNYRGEEHGAMTDPLV